MESKFKIGELVKVVQAAPALSHRKYADTLFDLSIPVFQDDSPKDAEAVVIGIRSLGGVTFYALRSPYLLRELIVVTQDALESLDNPPKPKKELTHMVVFRAILRSGILPACTCNVKSQGGPCLQTNWSERNELGRIKYFVTLTGERKTIEEVTEQFGE